MKLLSLINESYYSENVIIRDYSEKECNAETKEYFNNPEIKRIAPDAFSDKKEMVEMIKNAKPTKLSDIQLMSLMNSDISEVMDAEYPSDILIKLSEKYKRDWGSLVNAYAEGTPVPPPIVLKDEDGNMYLLAGNTRLMVASAMYKNIPVKIINYKGKFKI